MNRETFGSNHSARADLRNGTKQKKVFADPAVAYYLNRQEDGMDNCGPSNEWFEFTVVGGEGGIM